MMWMRHLPRFQAARRALPVLAQREQWSRDEIVAWQLARLNDLWGNAVQSVRYYRALSAEHHLPSRFDSLQQFAESVPILEKDCVRHQPDVFLSEQPTSGSWHWTGGSTGEPMRVYWSRDAHSQSLHTKYRMLQQWGVDIFDRSAHLWGHCGSMAPGLSGMRQRVQRTIEDRLRNRIRLNAYHLSESDLAVHTNKLTRFRPRSLYGYSSAISLLAQHVKQHSLRIPSLELAILTAEPADRLLRQQVARDLACDVAIEYGSVDCGVMATSDRDGRLRIREDVVLLESLSNAVGTFDLVVTVLNNPSFPLIRYRIEDMTLRPIVSNAYGFAVLPDVAGRDNDLLITRRGGCVHFLAVRHVLEPFRAIRRFRAHQHADGGLLVTIEAPASAEVRSDSIQSTLSRMLDGYRVKIERTETLPGNLAGKHRWIVSDLAANVVGRT